MRRPLALERVVKAGQARALHTYADGELAKAKAADNEEDAHEHALEALAAFRASLAAGGGS